jgi:hypothetical protein
LSFRANLLLVCLLLYWAPAAHAREAKPKFGPDAIPIQLSTEYLRSHRAPDYWAISPFYIAQNTKSDCSVASVTILINVLRGVPRNDDDLVTPGALLATVGNENWTAQTGDQGRGITFAELQDYVEQSLRSYGLDRYDIEVFKPADSSNESLTRLHRLLAENELSDRDVLLAYFNQGVLTGDWDGPHISPIGAYDAAMGRVLIMDVDRRYYVPYWSPVPKLLDGLLRPNPRVFAHLGGKTGGIIHVKPMELPQAAPEPHPATSHR